MLTAERTKTGKHQPYRLYFSGGFFCCVVLHACIATTLSPFRSNRIGGMHFFFHFSASKYVACPKESTLSSPFMFSEQMWKIPNNISSLEVN